MRRQPTNILIVTLALLCWSQSTFAVGIEKLVMPGRLVESHADIEGDCTQCHGGASDQPQKALCLDCHTELAADLKSGEGFHGLFPAARNNECVTCHTDHEGRNADITLRGTGVFDHRFTDFPLTAAHARAPCEACHAQGNPHREAPGTCVDCHRDDDVHGGSVGTQCLDCHTEERWNDWRFDHATTGYSLTGGHATVACQDCHQANNFKSASRNCVSCHAVDDVHEGSNGTRCSQCHSTTRWEGLNFNHGKETGFPLTAGHAGLACQSCHSTPDFRNDAEAACESCHLADDHHQGRNGTDCGSCHNTTAWLENDFDHRETAFPLVGAHTGIACAACHTQADAGDAPTDCGGCHKTDDPHAGQLGANCANCHEQKSWQAGVRFDHDLTRFPLIGLHASAACSTCHESFLFHNAGQACVDCHAEDDVHAGRLGTACSDCHTPNDWAVWQFDHDTQTSFPLAGKHAGLACTACHEKSGSVLSEAPSVCVACHRDDDVHDGQFDSHCDRCHDANSFSGVLR